MMRGLERYEEERRNIKKGKQSVAQRAFSILEVGVESTGIRLGKTINQGLKLSLLTYYYLCTKFEHVSYSRFYS